MPPVEYVCVWLNQHMNVYLCHLHMNVPLAQPDWWDSWSMSAIVVEQRLWKSSSRAARTDFPAATSAFPLMFLFSSHHTVVRLTWQAHPDAHCALQLRRAMNNDHGVWRWTPLSARTAGCFSFFFFFLRLFFWECSRRRKLLNTKTLKGHCRRVKEPSASLQMYWSKIKKSSTCRNVSDPDRSLFFFHHLLASFRLTSVSRSDCSTALLSPLLCTDNKPLHSSADSSSPKATLIVLKHTAPVKLIIVLAYSHFVAGPLTQRVRAFSAEPLFSCPLNFSLSEFQCCLFFLQ